MDRSLLYYASGDDGSPPQTSEGEEGCYTRDTHKVDFLTPPSSQSSISSKLGGELLVCKRIVECYLEDRPVLRNDVDALIRSIHGVRAYRKFKAETIARVLRVIQNVEGRYLPTDPKIIEKKMARSAAFRKHFGGLRE